MKKIIAAVFASLACASSYAASWDSDANIEKAANVAIKKFVTGGVNSMQSAAENCFNGLDKRRSNPNLGRDVEYCIALDSAALAVFQAIASGGPTETQTTYFDSENQLILKWVLTLDESRLIRTPEDISPYLVPRIRKAKSIVANFKAPKR